MRILSKSTARATAIALAVFALSCSRFIPWRNEATAGDEVNLAFTLDRNLIELQSVRIDNRPGRFILGSAAPQTIIDPRFALPATAQHTVWISEKTSVPISPAALDLGGVADATVGTEAGGEHALSTDPPSRRAAPPHQR